jgi:predicted unusual protein kinase regulating ubiquinone biosynthesis (AarF/ABC1/UbiB family)
MVMSVEQLKNEFKIWRVREDFILHRLVEEMVPATDLIELAETINRQIENAEKELKSLQDKKKQFDMFIDIAKEIRQEQLEEGLKEMKKYNKK